MQATFEIPCQEASAASWLAMPDGPKTTTQSQPVQTQDIDVPEGYRLLCF